MSMKPDPASGKLLKLSANEKGMSWCLERLKKDMAGREAKTLAIFQAVPLFYSALAVKREKKMSISQRNAAVVSAYKYAVGALLEWLQETHDFSAPSWLTIGLMGCTTLSPQGEKEKRYFDAKGDTTWNRCTDMQRTIRSQWMPWVNEYVVNSRSSQESLPSGAQEEDIWEALHSFLWQQTANSRKKMTREEYQRRSGDGCIGDLIETSTADTPVAQEANGIAVKEAEGETVTCRVPMPESWLHTYSLAFAFFGRFSDHPDQDIVMSMSDGPLEATFEGILDQSQSTNRIGGSWKKTLRGRTYAGETLSRAAQKKVKREAKVKSEYARMLTRLAEAIEKIATDTSERDAISAIWGMKEELAIANKQRKRAMLFSEREMEIGWLFQEIALRKDVGDDEGMRKAQARLLTMMGTPIGGEEVP